MNDLVSEYQQYQDATAEDEEEMDEEEMEWLLGFSCVVPNIKPLHNFTKIQIQKILKTDWNWKKSSYL
jgi:hypothetical protein